MVAAVQYSISQALQLLCLFHQWHGFAFATNGADIDLGEFSKESCEQTFIALNIGLFSDNPLNDKFCQGIVVHKTIYHRTKKRSFQ